MDRQNETKRRILTCCAPVLFHMKAGGTIFLPGGETGALLEIMAEWDTGVQPLYQDGRGTQFFIFQERLLEKQLSLPLNRDILRQAGYEEMKKGYCLGMLCQRYQNYRNGEGAFPHELGVFLGYPPEDIQGFLRKEGKESLFNGYWKVYANPREAVRQFYYFDRAREEAAGFFHD